MKKLIVTLSLTALVTNGVIDARGGGGHGGGGRGGGHSYHGGGYGGRGGYGRGGWAGGWAGPAFGVGLTVPLGGPSYEAPQPIIVQQPVAQQSVAAQPAAPAQPAVSQQAQVDPYSRYMGLFNMDPVKNKKAYRRWLFANYTPDQAQSWYNIFLTNYYNPYQASKPSASLSIGTGFGFGGGAYYGRGWGGRRW